MLHHWHASPRGGKNTGSGNTFADGGFSPLIQFFQLHDESLIVLVKQDSLSAVQIQSRSRLAYLSSPQIHKILFV